MAQYSNDLIRLWEHLSDAWGNFEDKATIQAMWEGIAGGSQLLLNKVFEVQNSKTIDLISPIIDDGPHSFTIIESGTGSNTVPVVSGPGIFKTAIDDWTLSIPTLVQTYSITTTSGTNTYYEGVNYTISGMNTLVWLTPPTWDLRYPSMHVLQLTTDKVERINPVLMRVWAGLLDLELDQFNQYNIFQTATNANKYKHLKYFVWALFTKRLQSPTIKNIQDALNIAAGMPFAYEDGTAIVSVVSNHYEITLGTQTFVLPNELTPCISNGASVKKFDILAKGISVYDYYNNPTLVAQFTNTLTRYNTILLYTTGACSLVTKSTTFYDDFLAKLLPVHFIVEENPLMSDTTVYMSSQIIRIN